MSRKASTSKRRKSSLAEDAAQLDSLGHKQELQRHHSTLSMLGLAFAILNSWTALAASLQLTLPSGGSTAIIWGLIAAGICNLCVAASLAEFLSAYPTAAGQYYWAHVVSPKKWARCISWITGWLNSAGWVALTATGSLLGAELIVGIISFMHANYVQKTWHLFLIYIVFTIGAFLINTFLNRILPVITQTAFIWSITGFVVISITVLACSSPNYQSGSFVYGDFINETGWPDGFAWLLGLLQGALGLTGFDATAHCIEEMPNPTTEGPKLMIYAILIGMFTGFIFLTCLLLVLKDVQQVITSSAGPLLQIFYDATNNKAGSVCLLMFPILCLCFATIGIMTTSSRMTWAFARDRGLPFSKVFAKVHPKLGVPVWSLLFTSIWVIILGCIFLGSTSAFNAIVSASVVCLGLSYGIPISINLARGRSMLPESRPFILPGVIGWTCNIVSVLWIVLTTVLFVFPPFLPVSGSNMNYCVAVLAVIAIFSYASWLYDGRKNYKGPVTNMMVVPGGETLGLQVEQTRGSQDTIGGDGHEEKKKDDPDLES